MSDPVAERMKVIGDMFARREHEQIEKLKQERDVLSTSYEEMFHLARRLWTELAWCVGHLGDRTPATTRLTYERAQEILGGIPRSQTPEREGSPE